MKNAILLHGKPGSGKSSCISVALERASLTTYDSRHHFSVGSHLRSVAAGDTPSQFAREVRKGTEQLGNHEPITHEVVNAVVAEYLGAISARSLVVIDGYPKYIEQIPPFEENVRLAGATILSIMHVVVPDEVAINRMASRGVRAGETGLDLEFAQRRLAEHDTGARVATEALAATYPIDVIDGTQPMSSVIWTMCQILESS